MTAMRAPKPPAQTTGISGSETPTRESAAELGRAFKACVGAVRRLRGRETRCHGELSDAQYGLLFGLRDHAALPSSELALLADLAPATATGMLDGLAADGLVTRVRSDQDRRVVLTSLTERGRALVAERHARFAPRFEAAMAEFSDDELRRAAAVLTRLGEMFDQFTPGGAAGSGSASAPEAPQG
jgi:DNA-binding MarR family transcriptional regulator